MEVAAAGRMEHALPAGVRRLCTPPYCAVQGRTGALACFNLQAFDLLYFAGNCGQDYLRLPVEHCQAACGPVKLMWPGQQ